MVSRVRPPPAHQAELRGLRVSGESVGVDGDVIDNGDGTWSHIVAADFNPDALEVESILTWAYVEQARYSWDPEPISGEQFYVATEDVSESVADQLLGTRRTRDGQTWEVVQVDEGALETSLAAQRAESTETEIIGVQAVDVATEIPGSVHSYFPQSWTRGDCDGTGGILHTDGDNEYWEGDEDRVAIDSTASLRRKSVVEIHHGLGDPVNTAFVCTGVIIRDQWVLTAAHCVVDANGHVYNQDEVNVVRRDRTFTYLPLDMDPILPDTYTAPPPDPKDDYALLHLAAPFVAPYGDMDLSTVNDATIESIADPINYALPAFAPNCSSNVGFGESPTSLYLNNDEILGSIFAKKINIKMEGGAWHSGSPVFYCPGGCTGSVASPPENKAYVLAVWSVWDGGATTHAGPKVASFADWAFGIMDSI